MNMEKTDYSDKKFKTQDCDPELKNRKIYYGFYRGVRYEINESPGEVGGHWTHYIHINIDDQLTKEFADKLWLEPSYKSFSEGGREHLSYNYWDSLIRDLDFHGGCTWYSKEGGPDEKSRRVKIGCDYQHLWDEGKDYGLNYIFDQAKRTIDSLIRVVGEVRTRSHGDGKWRYESEYSETKVTP